MDEAVTNQSGAGGKKVVVQVPVRAHGAIIYAKLNSVGGTSPIFDIDAYRPNPTTLDDGDLGESIAAGTQLTAAGDTHFLISSTTLGGHLAIVTTLDGTTGDEDYNYDVWIEWIEEV
jgi:hypothetical protein